MPLYPCQTDFIARTSTERAFACFWDMGLGKSRVMMETARILFAAREIDAALVIAPNGIHHTWIYDELPNHPHWSGLAVDSTSLKTKSTHAAFAALKSPILLTTTYDTLTTATGGKFIEEFLKTRRSLLVLDESARIKNPRALRTRATLRLAPLAAYRRILSGTPIANSPLDIYSQVQFLDPLFWKQHGIGSWWAFRARYAVLQKEYVRQNGVARQFDKIVGFRQLDELQAIVAKISSRVMKKDVLRLPPKVYSVKTFALSPQARRMYDQLKKQFFVEIGDGLMTAPLAVTRLVRMHQITSGIFTADDGQTETFPAGRLELLREIVEELAVPTIIWTHYTATTDAVMKILEGRAVRYDGQSSPAERASAVNAFRSGEKQFFVSKPSCGGEGLNLQAASCVIYAEHGFSLPARQQSEDRAYRIGQTSPLDIIDLVAYDSMDQKILAAISAKTNLAAAVLGDVAKIGEML